MLTYSYRAIDQGGRSVTGTIDADSLEAASNGLNLQGLIPVRVRPASSSAVSALLTQLRRLFTAVPARDLILFTKQFCTMTRAGVPILAMLDILESQTANRRLRSAVAEMRRDVQSGVSLSRSFRRHGDVFPTLYVTMVQAGEASGALPDVLDRLTYIIRHEDKVRSDVRAAVRYPLFVLGFLAFGFVVLQLFVVPKFAAVFTKAGVELPLPTRLCILVYEALSRYGLTILGVLAAALVALVLYLHTESGKYTRDALLLRIPLIGPLILKSVMARFSSIFAILQSSGVAVLDALDILAVTLGNRAIAREFVGMQAHLREGRGIAKALRSAAHFTPMVVNMVAIGEETGALDEMLREVAQNYDMEVEYSTQRLSDAIGPILTIGLAILVGFFALAIYMPMWDMTKLAR